MDDQPAAVRGSCGASALKANPPHLSWLYAFATDMLRVPQERRDLPLSQLHAPLATVPPSPAMLQTCYAYPKSDVTIKTHAEEEMLGM